MAILNTPIQQLPYPDENSLINSTDEYVRNLAKALEGKLLMVFASAADRDSKLTTPTEGMMAWLQDVDKLYLRTGTAWVQFYPIVPAITSGSTVPASTSGSIGDIFIQY